MPKINPFDNIKTVFKDASTLDQGWSPNWETHTLPCREDVIKSLTALYNPVLVEKGALNLNSLILGRGGVGKTVTARYFAKLFRDAALSRDINIVAEYIDCNEHATKNSILREVLGKLRLTTGRGYSDPELMKQLVGYLKNNNRYLFLVLDEVHKLQHDDLLSFLNASITFGSHNVRMSFLCTTRAGDWLKFSTERLTSRIHKVFNLKPYNFDEALKILKFRNNLAFYSDVFTDEVLELIAEQVEKEKNMRIGIELLRTIAHHLDENGLDQATPEIVRIAGGNVISNYDTELLNYLNNEHEYLILLAIARWFLNTDAAYVTTNQIKEYYDLVAEEFHVEKLKFPSIKRYVKRLETVGILHKRFALPEGKEKGRESRFSLHEYSADILNDQLTKILNNNLK